MVLLLPYFIVQEISSPIGQKPPAGCTVCGYEIAAAALLRLTMAANSGRIKTIAAIPQFAVRDGCSTYMHG